MSRVDFYEIMKLKFLLHSPILDPFAEYKKKWKGMKGEWLG
jgi:hypothetical protein